MIQKILTISNTHIKKSTINVLERDAQRDLFSCLDVVHYGNRGYIININAQDFETYNRFNQDMPNDLQTIVAFAIESECSAVCITSDENDPIFYIPHYKYVSRADEYGQLCNFEDCYCGGRLLASVKVGENGETLENGPAVKSMRSYFGQTNY